MAYFKTSDKVDLSYKIHGQGRPVVLIHGWSGRKENFAYQVKDLRQDYKVVTYDLRGHGKSERVDRGLVMKRYAMDLKELIDYLQLDKPILVGWSMGTSIIFEYSKVFGLSNIGGLCLLDMTPKFINDEEWKLGLNFGKFTLEDSYKTLSIICNDWPKYANLFLRSALIKSSDKEINLILKEAEENSPFVMCALWIGMAANDYRPILKDIDVPTKIIYGVESTMYCKNTGEYLRDNIRGSELIPIEKAGHFLIMEEPDQVNMAIRKLLVEID